MKIPKGYTKSPWKWVRGTPLAPYYNPETAGFYHVTTRVSDVLRDGSLKSRGELEGIVGLGGGPDNLVSFTFDLRRAQKLYYAIHSVAQWVNGSIFGKELILRMLRWNRVAMPYEGKGYFEDEHLTEEYLRDTIGNILFYLDWSHEEITTLLKTGKYNDIQLNNLLQGYDWNEVLKEYQYHYENSEEVWHALISIESTLLKPGQCVDTVNFMGELSEVENWQPQEIGIVQCAVRNNADVDYFATECELRFLPQDILLLGLEHRVN